MTKYICIKEFNYTRECESYDVVYDGDDYIKKDSIWYLEANEDEDIIILTDNKGSSFQLEDVLLNKYFIDGVVK